MTRFVFKHKRFRCTYSQNDVGHCMYRELVGALHTTTGNDLPPHKRYCLMLVVLKLWNDTI